MSSEPPRLRGLTWALGAFGKQILKEWKLAKQRGEQQEAAIAVLNVGRWRAAADRQR
jgi:hypothetical protein